MLALIYTFATAKPISMRRLSLLFVFVLISATLVLRVLDVRRQGAALLTATLVTLFVWSAPLFQIMHATASRRALSFDALRQVSGFVRWTYGFVLAAVPIVAVSAIMNPTPGLHRALPRLLAIAAIVALASTIFIPRLLLPRSRGQAASGPYMPRRNTCCSAPVAPVSRSRRSLDLEAWMRVDERDGAFPRRRNSIWATALPELRAGTSAATVD